MSSSYRRRRLFGLSGAFTLTELLVVIGIIAVLIGLLLPGLRSAMDGGKKAKCQSQLQQLFVAINMYANDNSFIYPNINNDSPGGAENGFAHYLGTYLDDPNPSIFKCSNPSSSSDGDSYYYYNDDFNIQKPASLDKLTLGDPATSIYIFVCRKGWKNGEATTFYPHGHGVNVVYGDGHVAYERKQ